MMPLALWKCHVILEIQIKVEAIKAHHNFSQFVQKESQLLIFKSVADHLFKSVKKTISTMS